MHQYSIDRDVKQTIFFLLAAVAIYAAPKLSILSNQLLHLMGTEEVIGSGVLVTLPTFALFGFVCWVFDRFFWKVRVLRKTIMVPDLNGEWKVSGKTIQKQGLKVDLTWEGTIIISQSWSKICVRMKAEKSQSVSVAASIRKEAGLGYRLLYSFENTPSADQRELNRFSGTCDLIFEEGTQSAEGHYYSDQNRSTVGTMTLERKLD